MQKLSHSFDNFTIAMTFCQVCTKILRGKLKIFLDKCYRRCILLSMLRTETTLKPVEDRMNQLKCRKVGGKAFPNDFNWQCPTCGNENRAFQLPCQEKFTLQELEESCQYCQHEKVQS